MTKEEKIKIAAEVYENEPIDTIGHLALLKLGRMGVETGAANVQMTTEATFNNKRYSISLTVNYKELK